MAFRRLFLTPSLWLNYMAVRRDFINTTIIMTDPLTLQILTGVLIGLGAGYVGSFMVLRRMSLVGDALSHVALPGIAIAISLNVNPILGAIVFLLIAAVI